MPKSNEKTRELRLALLENGYTPLPLIGKKPGIEKWQILDVNPSLINSWDALSHLPDTGIRCSNGEVIGLDIDIDDPFLAAAVSAEIRQHLDNTPLERVGREPRSLLPYRTYESFRKKILTFTYKGLDEKIEVLAQGQQFAAFGIHPDTKKNYKWLGGRDPQNTTVDELPLVTETEVDQCLSRLEEFLESIGATDIQRHPDKASKRRRLHQFNSAGPKNPIHPDYLGAALEHLDADDYDEWIRVGMAIHQVTNGSPDGLSTWDKWSQKSGKYDETRQNECEYKWQSFSGSANPVTAASIIYSAKNNGFDPSKHVGPKELLPPVDRREAKTISDENAPGRAAGYSGPPTFPEELIDPPGLVGRIARYCNRASYRDQPMLALCAGLVTTATLGENRFQVERFHTPLNISVVAVAETGDGKEAPRKAIKACLKEVDRLSVVKESAASAPALLRAISDAARSNLTLLIDEFGRWLSTARSPNQGYQFELVSEIMKLYSEANDTHVGRIYANSKDNIAPIERPYVNIFGTTTQRSLTDALSNRDVVDGFMNRLLIVHTNSRMPAFKDPDAAIDEGLHKSMSNLAIFDELEFNEEEITTNYDSIQIRMDNDAEGHLISFRDRAEQDRTQDQRLGALWARAFENALKLAGIIAVGCAAEDGLSALVHPRISLDIATWATTFVDYCIRRTVFLGSDEIADNQSERAVNKIRNYACEMVSNWDNTSWKTDHEFRDQNLAGYVSLSQITRRFQKIPRRMKEEAIATLVDSGEISPVQGDGDDRTTWYQVLN